MGPAPLMVLTLTVGGLAMAGLEAATRGRHRLAGTGLFVALATVGSAAVGAGMGAVRVLQLMGSAELLASPEKYREIFAVGMMEALSNLPYAIALALVQAFVWAVVLRREKVRS